MADYALGFEGTITLNAGSGPPTEGSVRAWGMGNVKRLVDVTTAGSLFRKYKNSLSDGDVWFDLLIDTSVAGSSSAPLPSGTEVAFVGRFYSTTRKWSMNIMLESATLMGAGVDGETRQIMRYRGKVNSAITPA